MAYLILYDRSEKSPVKRPISNSHLPGNLGYTSLGTSQVVLVVKNPLANANWRKRCGFDPWVRKIPWRKTRQLTPLVWLAWLQGLLRKTKCLYKHHPHLLGVNRNSILGLFSVVKLLCFNELSPNGVIFWLIYSKKYYLRISMRFTKILFLVTGSLRTTPVSLPGESPWTESLAGYSSMGSRRGGHDWSDLAGTLAH